MKDNNKIYSNTKAAFWVRIFFTKKNWNVYGYGPSSKTIGRWREEDKK